MGRVLTRAQVARYEEDGVLFPVPALGPSELAGYRGGLEAVEAQIGDDRRPERFAQWHLCFRWAYDLATHPAILDAAEDLLGPDLLVHTTTAFAKPPRSPSFVSWHQDGYYLGLDRPRFASAWVALSDSTPESGCLRVIPGSHRGARLGHVVRRHEHNMLGTGLNLAEPVDESRAVDVRLRAGEMSFHHVDLVHGSNPNVSDAPRLGFAIRYVTPDVAQARPHHEAVLARGHDRHGHFRLLDRPPGDSLAEGLRAQEALSRWRLSLNPRD
jgi:ectoine hydroxylase-related dioxygenase (phytanoyl-CoA dioxygenase family)